MGVTVLGVQHHFYPRSPCGERHTWQRGSRITYVISIHALLAESDGSPCMIWSNIFLFLSTLSLRRATHSRLPSIPNACISIHALLAESDGSVHRTIDTASRFLSTLSLRRATVPRRGTAACRRGFLSTLSLRRATSIHFVHLRKKIYFYPRSPCGERPAVCNQLLFDTLISIHALLAESDRRPNNHQ